MKARQGMPYGLGVLIAVFLQLAVASGQTPQHSESKTPEKSGREAACPPIIEEASAPWASSASLSAAQAQLERAIVSKLGSRYRRGAAGERGYDCSGFVWRVFKEIGSDVSRLTSREMFRSLPAATQEQSRQLGTLVFFRGLKHVGIVKDGTSFYHASRHHGVILSRFEGYWEGRIKGFRTVPALAAAAP